MGKHTHSGPELHEATVVADWAHTTSNATDSKKNIAVPVAQGRFEFMTARVVEKGRRKGYAKSSSSLITTISGGNKVKRQKGTNQQNAWPSIR